MPAGGCGRWRILDVPCGLPALFRGHLGRTVPRGVGGGCPASADPSDGALNPHNRARHLPDHDHRARAGRHTGRVGPDEHVGGKRDDMSSWVHAHEGDTWPCDWQIQRAACGTYTASRRAGMLREGRWRAGGSPRGTLPVPRGMSLPAGQPFTRTRLGSAPAHSIGPPPSTADLLPCLHATCFPLISMCLLHA